MDAITTPSITSLADKLRNDTPSFVLTPSTDFRWDPDTQTIFFDASSDDIAALLHEVAHALLGHTDYRRDVELLEMERAAWQHATTQLAPRYHVEITDDRVEDALDTYRDWLHARSTCPSCKATGLQIKEREYRCVACFTQWHVNDGRTCALRRWKNQKDAS